MWRKKLNDDWKPWCKTVATPHKTVWLYWKHQLNPSTVLHVLGTWWLTKILANPARTSTFESRFELDLKLHKRVWGTMRNWKGNPVTAVLLATRPQLLLLAAWQDPAKEWLVNSYIEQDIKLGRVWKCECDVGAWLLFPERKSFYRPGVQWMLQYSLCKALLSPVSITYLQDAWCGVHHAGALLLQV